MDLDLPSTPHDVPAAFAARFKAGEPALLADLFPDGSLLVPTPGRPVAGPEILAGLSAHLGLGLPVEVALRHVYQADDIALLIVDWRIAGVSVEGDEVDITGTATDVVRRGADGRWRYAIDNPFGAARV